MEENKNYEKNFDLNNFELPTNEPKFYKEYISYAKILNEKIKDDDIKNIGIIAPYGAGKSSLIKTYTVIEKINGWNLSDEEIIEKEKKISKSRFNSKKIVNVSLANFTSILKSITDENLKNNVSEQDIEKSILQQLFYKNDNKKTPKSRFYVLKNNKLEIIINSFFITFLLNSFIYFLIIDKFLGDIKLNAWWNIIIFIIDFCSLFWLVFIVINKRNLKSLHFGDLSFEKNADNEISIFNKYLDEIIYFFRENSFNVLIIEDLDRFNNLAIFSKLRELNILLNNNDKIKKKHKKITFIYAVKDSMFSSEEERGKFFDFMLSIIPSLTSNNIKDEINNEFEKYINFNPISPQLMIEISNYITNRRVLNNIISDFLIHSLILNIDLHNENKANKLFTLMVLKNLFPLEYEQLQNQDNNSIIYMAFNEKKQKLINSLRSNYDEQIQKYNNKIIEINNERLKSINELKLIFHGLLCKKYNSFYNIDCSITTFKDIDEVSFSYINGPYSTHNSSRSVYVRDIEEFGHFSIGEFGKREELLNEISQRNSENLFLEIEKINKKISILYNSSFKELIDNNAQIDDVCFENKEFIKFVLVNGYIDETYPNYLSTNSNGFISEKDKKIIMKINLKEKIDTFSELDSANKIILSLDKERFSLDSILNYYLLNELLTVANNDYIKKRKKLIESIKNKSLNIKEFIEKILNSKENCFKVLLVFCKECSFVFDDICNNSKISDNKKESLLFYLLNELELNDLKNINRNNNIVKLINTSHNFCVNFMPQKYSINELLGIMKFSLQHIGDDGNKSKLFEEILNNNYYELNLENIQIILINYYQYNKDDVFFKNYDLIKKLDDCAFKNRIETNLSQYLNLIYDDNSGEFICGQLSSDNFLNLLLNNEIDDQLKFKIIKKENNKVIYSSNLTIEIVENLMIENKIILFANDLTILIDKINKEILIKYIERNNNQLEINDSFLENNANFKTYFFNNINISLFKDRIKNKYNNISNIQNDNNINYLLNNDLVLYESDDFKSLIEQKRYIRNYCTKFEKEITNDIELDKLILNDSLMANLYFAICTNKSELLKVILKKMSIETGKMILDSESKDIFIQEVNSYDVNENIKSLFNNFIEEKDTIKYK